VAGAGPLVPLDPLWKRALKAVVEIKDPPPPPPPEPIPQAAYDELDGALKIQERREARQARAAPPPPAASEDAAPVDADGNVRFEAVYAQARVPNVPFTAEQALDMLGNMPADVSEKTRQQVINVALGALGRSVGGTPEAIVADAARKQAALQEFRRTRGGEVVDLTGAARARIAEMQGEIAKSEALIAEAGQQYEALTRSCQAEEARLDTVIDFFSRTPPQAGPGA